MITLIIVLIVTVSMIAYFYLKCSVMTAFSTFMASIFGSIIAFTYYEMLAELLISHGYGIWAPAGCFALAFLLGFAVVLALVNLLAGTNIDFGNGAKMTVNLVLGTLTGLIFSGHLLVSMGMMPISGIYNRFPTDSPISLKSPKRPFLNPDGMVTNLFSLFSRGSLSSGNSFGVFCADFINRNHLNRYGVSQDATTICSKKALSVPKGSLKPVRFMEFKDVGTVTVIRAVISAKDISDGGAATDKGVVFTLSQVRAIAKTQDKANNFYGLGQAFWPIGILEQGKLVQKTPSEIITFTNKDFRKDTREVWVDFVFQIEGGKQPVLLQFKQNAMTALPPPVQSSEEIEKALGSTEGV